MWIGRFCNFRYLEDGDINSSESSVGRYQVNRRHVPVEIIFMALRTSYLTLLVECRIEIPLSAFVVLSSACVTEYPVDADFLCTAVTRLGGSIKGRPCTNG